MTTNIALILALSSTVLMFILFYLLIILALRKPINNKKSNVSEDLQTIKTQINGSQ
jgi:F0F1-type ATP synthase membrane subunit b/b'